MLDEITCFIGDVVELHELCVVAESIAHFSINLS